MAGNAECVALGHCVAPARLVCVGLELAHAEAPTTIERRALVELVESIVQILEQVLGVDHGELLARHVSAVLQLLPQAIQ
jgi:hypothetical protein